jgi:threonine dehydrogenase-like Zn-dependent dehydrogenase
LLSLANTYHVAVSSETTALKRNLLMNKQHIVHGSRVLYMREAYRRLLAMLRHGLQSIEQSARSGIASLDFGPILKLKNAH